MPDVQIVITALDRASGPMRNIRKELDTLNRQDHTTRGLVPPLGRVPSVGPRARQPPTANPPGGRMGAGLLNSAAVGGLGISAGMLGAGGVAYGLVKATTAAADFQSQLTAIQKKAGTTAEETARIGKEAMALATGGKLATSIDEIMSAFERGAAAGIPLDELSEFARLSAMAADAFDMSAEDVGNAAAGFKTGLGVTMGGMEEYFGLINKLADSGIADESGIISFLDRAGANMKLFGLSAEQAAAYAATLGNIKMPAEVGARMMNSLTSTLLAPGSKKAEASLKGIVGNVDNFQKMLKSDANGALEFFLEKVNELDKFKSAELLTGLLGKGFSDEVLRLSAATGELKRNQAIAKDRAGYSGGLQQSYDLKLDDFWSKWQQVKNALKVLQIQTGEMAMPGLTSGLEAARGIIEDIAFNTNTMAIEIDVSSIGEARTSLAELGKALSDALNLNTDDSEIATFFHGLADAINQASEAARLLAKYTTDAINLVKDPVKELTRDKTAQEYDDYGLHKITPEERAAMIAKKKAEEDGANAAADRKREIILDQQGGADVGGNPLAIPEGTGSGGLPLAPRGGRVGKPTFSEQPLPKAYVKPSRFGGDVTPPAAAPAAPAPTQIAGGAPAAPSTGEVTAFLAAMGQAQQAKQAVESPINVDANLNDAAFMGKLTAMKAAAREAAASISATLSSIGGASTPGSNKYQFAPGGPK